MIVFFSFLIISVVLLLFVLFKMFLLSLKYTLTVNPSLLSNNKITLYCFHKSTTK
jgi:hypothetical protein